MADAMFNAWNVFTKVSRIVYSLKQQFKGRFYFRAILFIILIYPYWGLEGHSFDLLDVCLHSLQNL